MTTRIADNAIEPIFLDRWSPRAFDGSTIGEGDLMRLFEAARWAPSASNYQPWTFLYAHREDENWDIFLSALVPFNQSWVKNASALIYVISDTMMQSGPDAEATPLYSHSFDAGAAWANLALQATRQGLYTHGMTGVDFDAARMVLQVPERFRMEAAIAVGRKGDPSILPEKLQEREVPSGRKPVSAFVQRGPFSA